MSRCRAIGLQKPTSICLISFLVVCVGCGHSSIKTPSTDAQAFTNSIGMKFVRIAPGDFLMGSDLAKGIEHDEQPAHRISLSYGFYCCVYEVRRKDFVSIVNMARSSTASASSSAAEFATEGDEFPIVNISWEDACEFCRRLSDRPEERQRGRFYRLPTEAEWEYCCRAGTNTAFSSGDELDFDAANFRHGRSEKPDSTSPILCGSFRPNSFGLYDMHGNVWEWCLDWYGEHFYQDSSAQDPTGPTKGTRRVIRGGGWNSTADLCRSAFRDSKEPSDRASYLGFRVICLTGVFSSDQSQPVVATSPAAGSFRDISEIIEFVEPSVVAIATTGPKATGLGSGFLVFNDRTIVTNYHVIEQATDVQVQFANGTNLSASGVVAALPEKDLAFLRLEKPYTNARPLSLAKQIPHKGELAVAFGSPLGLSFTASDGIVSAIRNEKDMRKFGLSYRPKVTWVQMTAPISPGNSGGPLVNSHGEVIGVNTLIVRGNRAATGQSLNFAVSAADFPDRNAISTTPQPMKDQHSDVLRAIRQLEDILGQSTEAN